MAVDLNDLVDALKASVNPPGSDLYPDATDDEWVLRLSNGFWDAKIKGLFPSHEENAAARGGPVAYSDFIVTPTNPAEDYDSPTGWNEDLDLSREMQQLVVLWSAWRITLAKFQEITTTFRARAPGPTEWEEQRSAQVLKAVLDSLKEEIAFILNNLSTYGSSGGAMIYDAVIERTYATAVGEVWWVR
jgi:hypothetical protein